MREPNRPGPSSNNQQSGQPPGYHSPSTGTQGVRSSFNVVNTPHIPQGQSLPPSNVSRSTAAPPQPSMPPQQLQVETLLHVLSDQNPRMEPKVQCLREFLDNYDELSVSPIYLNNARGFLNMLLRLMSETTPQFIAENEINRLRKLILEVLQRMSLNEHIRQFSREIQKLLFGVILHDNEDTALLAVKVMIDHVRGLRLQFSPDIANFFAQIRNVYRNFVDNAQHDSEIFMQPLATSVESIEYALEYILPTAHYAQPLHLDQRGGPRSNYTLLPRAGMSVRVFSELSILLLNLNQVHRQHVYEEVMEILPVMIRFVCIQVPENNNLNKSMIDEFHASQIRALSFLSYIAKGTQVRQQNYPQRALVILEEKAEQLTAAINHLLENLNPYVTTARRDFIVALKSFIDSDIKHRFVGIIPRLTSDRCLLGEKFTSQDNFRYFLYHNLADLLYKIRQHLTYPMLLHSFKVCIRCIHDNQLAPNYQMMYLKLIRSLCEPIVERENRYNEPAREVLILSFEALIKKLQVIADHYLSALSAQIGKSPLKSPQQLLPISPQKESMTELSRSETKDQELSDQRQPAPDGGQSSQWQDQPSLISPSDCRNMIKYIFLPVQEIVSRLGKCHLTEDTNSMFAERQLLEQFFIQSIRCLEVFKIVSAVAQLPQQLKTNLAKDEKETVETFALVFNEADPKMFQYIFSRQINFFIDAFIGNPSVQLVCKMFLLSDKTFTSTGSILMKHMLQHMSELGAASGGTSISVSNSTDKTNVYIRLFREIFHIVSGMNNDQQQQRVTSTAAERQARSKEHEAMLIPYLHQIVSDSIQLALRSRDPQHYFALLHALFRSIGTGSHDQLYQQFLPLLPSILQQLNRFQNGSYRQPIHDLYVELCLTVPVRLSSLLPYLPLLMDPLVCALHGPSKLVMQGLRTLELFVNNLQLDYVYDQMLPVRAALMQGIWRALYTQENHYAMLALKILGKLGGSSRRAFLDAQNFTYLDLEEAGRSIGPRALYAAGHRTYDHEPPKLCIQTELKIERKPDIGPASRLADPGPQKRRLDAVEEQNESTPRKQQLIDETVKDQATTREEEEAQPTTEHRQPTLKVSAQLPMAQMVESALSMIRTAMATEPSPPLHLNWSQWMAGMAQSTNIGQHSTPGSTSNSSNKGPRQHAVDLCKTIILQAIDKSPLLKMNTEEKLRPVFQKAMRIYLERKENGETLLDEPFRCEDQKARAVIGSALTGLFYAVVSPDLRPQSLSIYRAIVSHLTLQALLESMVVDLDKLGVDEMEVESSFASSTYSKLLDSTLLIDVICQTLSDSCKHFSQAGIVALRFITTMVKSLFSTKEELNQAYELPFFKLLLQRVYHLTCRRNWFAKLGGCTALRFFVDNFEKDFVIKNTELFMNAFFGTISDLADEVSYAAIDVASKTMDQLMDVCSGQEEDGSKEFDPQALNKFTSLIANNLANPEQQIRMEANRLLLKLQELTGKTKLDLLKNEIGELKRTLINGLVQFSSMSFGSQTGFLDFITHHLLDLQLPYPQYADHSLAFSSNLITIINETDIALHSMPSSRYSITNLPGGSHSLEDQMRQLRLNCLQALREHSKALLLLKNQIEDGMDEKSLRMERLMLAMAAIDVDGIQVENRENDHYGRQLERMKWVLHYAYQLADLPEPDSTAKVTRDQLYKAKKQLKVMLDELHERNVHPRSAQNDERQRLLQILEIIVEFSLQLCIHPIHPLRLEARDLLKMILDEEPRFKLRVHSEIHQQFQQMQPFVMLNSQMDNPLQNVQGSLDAHDLVKFLPHVVPSSESEPQPQQNTLVDGDGVVDTGSNDRDTTRRLEEIPQGEQQMYGQLLAKTPQPSAMVCVDLNDPSVLTALLEGQMAVQIEDQEGRILAVGETVSFAPVDSQAKKKIRHISESNMTKHVKELEEFEKETTQEVEQESLAEPIEISRVFKREVYVVVGRRNNEFKYVRYHESMPPRKPGTFIIITTFESGQQLRTICNYAQDMFQRESEALDICQSIEKKVEEAAELQRRQDFLLADRLDQVDDSGQHRYNMFYGGGDVPEGTAHLASMLMQEAQSLGLDKPSSKYTVAVRPSNLSALTKRRTSSGVSAADFQELIDMSDTEMRELGEEIIQQLPDFRSPEKQQQDFVLSRQQPPHTSQATFKQNPTTEMNEEAYMDPVQEVVASMRAAAAAQKQIQESQQQQMPTISQYEPSYAQQSQYVQQGTSATTCQQQYGQMIYASTNSPISGYHQHQQFVHHPDTSSPMPINQPVMQETESQRHEQENGLDAEYAMRHNDQFETKRGDVDKAENMEQGDEMVEDAQEGPSSSVDIDPDEYLIVQTTDAWRAPTILNVPVSSGGSADFSRIRVASDQILAINDESKTIDDAYIGQLDDEPLVQYSNAPFNPILMGTGGKPVITEEEEIESDGEEIAEDAEAEARERWRQAQLNEGEEKLKDEQIDDDLRTKEEELKSKNEREDVCDQSSEGSSFEFVTSDNDRSQEKEDRRTEIGEKLETRIRDMTAEHRSLPSTNFLVRVPNLTPGLNVVELDPDALKLMQKTVSGSSSSPKPGKGPRKLKLEEKRLVLRTKKVEEESSCEEFEGRDGDSDIEIPEDSPYSHITNAKLRRFLHQLCIKSPRKAEEAVNFYVRRMTKLLQQSYSPKLETESSGIRIEYAQESIRLPTGHIVETLPRTHFNYLPEEVFEELQAFDEVEDEFQKEVDALANQLRAHSKINDEELEQLFEYQSVNSQKLEALVNLRLLVDAHFPPRLLSYLAGEVAQIFKMDLGGGELNDEHLLQLKAMLWLLSSPDQNRPIDFLLNALSFVAELDENLDVQDKISPLLEPLSICLDLEAPTVVNHILQWPFLEVLACRRMAHALFERKEAVKLRRELLQRLDLIEQLLKIERPTENSDVEMEEVFPIVPSKEQRLQVQIDCFLLRLLHILSEHLKHEFFSDGRVVDLVHTFWKSRSMNRRYSTHRAMEDNEDVNTAVAPQLFDSMLIGEKFDVPELCVRLMLSYIREHQDRIDLLFDCCAAFCHEYVTDFTFLTKYIEDEIVPIVSLEWRHKAYRRLIDFFLPKSAYYPDKDCILLAKFTQHVLIPCFQHAFNNQPIDDVVGAGVWPDSEENDSSIIWKFCHIIIDPYYKSDAQSEVPQLPVPETLKIVLYQFCSMLVQRCPDHIHPRIAQRQRSNVGKLPDNCLRPLMLFSWHCIQNQLNMDLPEKYAGQFLIANLMEKFAIRREIINQAISSLLAAHHQDLRSIVNKSLDIIIPVVAGRAENSDLQLFETIKKTMDESQQHSQILHCIGILTRHFKVFFRARQQIADLLIHSVQRLHASQTSLENKRTILEICETILKWENQRNDLLEKAQAQDPPAEKVQQPAPLPAIEVENIQKTFDRRIIDQILQWLLRIATSTDQPVVMQAHGADPYSLVRKALVILRRAIKPQIFGSVPLRTGHLERQLQLTQQRAAHEELAPEQQTAVYNQVTQTLDIITAIVSYLTPDAISDFMHSLQRPVSACVSSTNMSVAQSCFKLIGKLAEQTAANQGSELAEFEVLNTEIGRYLNDSMNFVASSGFSQQMNPSQSMQLISKCLALLRVICKFHPTYLEATCFVAFLRMFQRLVLEYNPMMTQQSTGQTGVDPRQKIAQDLCSCMDLLKGRLHALNTESRRAIDKELQALSDKPIFVKLKDSNLQSPAPVRRVVEKLMEMLFELIRLDAGSGLAAPMGLKLLVHVFEKMQPHTPLPGDLIIKFLSAVQIVFEDKALRKCELAEKLHIPFFWGLAQIDQPVWYQFFRLFESQFPGGLFERLMHIISEQNWLPLSNKFWIPHCIHLLLRSATSMETTSLKLQNCATFSQTADRLGSKLHIEFETDTSDMPQTDGETQPNCQETVTNGQSLGVNATDNASSLDSNPQVAPTELFVSGKILLDMLQNQTYSELSRQLAEMSQADHRLASVIFTDLFSSLWNQIPSANGEKRKRVAEFFLQSGQLATNGRQMSLTPLSCFYKAANKCTTPAISVDSVLLENLAVDHRLWFEAVDELERRLRHVDDARKQLREHQTYTQQMKNMDNLASIYSQLGEDDLKAALWKKRACLPGTFRSIELFNQGMFKEARLQSRLTMNEGKDKMFEDALLGPQRKLPPPVTDELQQNVQQQEASSSETVVDSNQPPVQSIHEQPSESKEEPMDVQIETRPEASSESVQQHPVETIRITDHFDIRAFDLEMRQLESVWINACRELNDWSSLTRYANCNDIANAELLGDAAWHQSEWSLCRELSLQIEASGARSSQFTVSMLQAMAQVASGEFVQKTKVEELNSHLIVEWRGLPSLVTPAHMGLIRMAQRVQELIEANQINKIAVDKIVRLQPGAHHITIGTPNKQFPAFMNHRYAIDPELISCIKQTVKTWRNRYQCKTIIDPASHWSDTFTWRVQQYWAIMRMFENADNPSIAQQGQSMHPLHSISQAQINYARTLRKNELFEEAASELSMLHAMSQVHPIDAGMSLHEQTKCVLGLSEKIRRQRKYGEQCLAYPSSGTPPYLKTKKEPEELVEMAIRLMDSARIDILSNDQLARLLAVKASIYSQFNENQSEKADELFAASSRLIESSTITPGTQSTNITNTMAASQLIWKYCSLHWERKFKQEFPGIWRDGNFNVSSCQRAYEIALETMTTLLECMRSATDYRARKFGARFFHFLRSAHALKEQLKEHEFEGESRKRTTVEEVLKKHAGAVSPINWLFWLEQIVYEIRSHSSKEMTKILCAVADAYPQQVLIVLRSAIWPELITQRIKFVQERLPLISDWIRCAPPLDVTGVGAANESIGEDQPTIVSNSYERCRGVEKLHEHEEQFADAFTLWRVRNRDRHLLSARRQLIKFLNAYKTLEAQTDVDPKARERLDKTRRQLEMRYLRLKQMKKLGRMPEVPTKTPPRCLNMTVYEKDVDLDDEEVHSDQEESAAIYKARLRVPQTDKKGPFNILIDTSHLDLADFELQIDIEEDRGEESSIPELELESKQDPEKLASWIELILQAVDSMCVVRYADVRALNSLLNELDQMPMPWIQLVHSELVSLADYVHSEAFKLLPGSSDETSLPEQIRPLMELFADSIHSNYYHGNEEECLRQEIASELDALKTDNWPLKKVCISICRWLQTLETRLNGLDELIPLRSITPTLASFSSKLAHLDICSAWSPMKTQFSTQISHFLPMCRRQFHPTGTVLFFGVLSQNGKTYTYKMERKMWSVERQRSQQLFSLIKNELLTNREVCRRSAQFSLPDVFHTGLNYQIMECAPLSGALTYQLFQNAERYGNNLKSLSDIASLCFKWGGSSERKSIWSKVQDVFEGKECDESNQMLAQLMRNIYPDSSTHWMIRKKFAVQWALYAAVQLATGMTSLNLREMHLDLASSQLFCTAHSFGLEVGSSGNIQLSNSPQYRLTPNLAEYMQVDIEEDGTVHLPGHLTGCFVAACRALSSRSFGSLLHALFWDLCEMRLPEGLDSNEKNNKLILGAQELPLELTERLKSLSVFTDRNFKAIESLEQSTTKEARRKISPSQHPWF